MPDDKKFSAKEFEEYYDTRNQGEQTIIDKTLEQFNIQKQISKLYDGIQSKLQKEKQAHADISKQIAEQEKKYSENRRHLVQLKDEHQALTAEYQQSIDRLAQINKLGLDRTEELQKEAAAIENINKLEESRTKNNAAIDINKKAIRDNLEKQKGMAEKLKQVEDEMAEVQLRSIRDGMDLTDEYNKLTSKREFFQKRINSLLSDGNKYQEDAVNLEARRGNISKNLENYKELQKIAQENLATIAEKESLEERVSLIMGQIQTNEEKTVSLGRENLQLENSLSKLGEKRFEIEQKIAKLNALFLMAQLVKMAFDRFVQLDAAAERFRRETGFSVTQMEQLRKNAEEINVQFSDMGVSIEKVYESAKALSDVFGRTTLITQETLKNVSLLSANLNVAEADSANVLAMFQGLGNATEQAAMNVIKVGAGISDNAGVPFSLVMKDIANASEQTTALIGANPSKLMKSAIAARALGTDLNKIVASQRKLLDFSSSINDELDASAMLGKNISFQKARQLAYDGDIEGAAKATLETVRAAGDFDKMSVYQREALAKASGMELKDLTKMMAVDKQREAIMNGTDEAKKATLKAQEAELEKLKEIDDLNDADLVKQNEKALMQQKMQGVMTKLKNLMESISVAFADILEPVITPLMEILVPVFKILAGILKYTLVPVLKFIAFPIVEGVKAVQKLFEGFQKGKDEVKKTGQEVSSFFKFFESGWGYALKIIGGLAAGGLLGMAMFGKLGAGGISEIIKTPFKKLGGLVSKIPGVGGMFGKNNVAQEGIGKAAESTKSVPKGEGVKDFLKNLAAGLKAMGNTKVLFGAANLLVAAAPLAIIAPVALLASVLGAVGKPIEIGLKFLSKGIGHMGNTNVLKGAMGIALVGVSIIPFAFAMKMFSAVDWGSVGIGALALVGFTAAAYALGTMMMSVVGGAVFVAGALAIAALGIALIPFGVAALAAGAGIKMLGEGISSSVDPILRLSEIDLTTTAIGITAVGAALAAFGGGSAAAGLGSFVGKFLSGDPIEKIENLAEVGDKLKVTADSITAISQSAAQFSSINSFADAISKLAESLNTLNTSINKFGSDNVNKLSQITSASGTQSTTTPAGTAATGIGMDDKLDELISLMKQGYITATVDLDKLSGRVAQMSGR